MKPASQQVVVITGASSGIGLATARAFASAGARVVLAARNAGDLERETEEIRRRYSARALAVPTDVTRPEQVEVLARRAAEEFGRIDSWVNNAGVALYGAFRQTSLQDFRQVMEVNFFGQLHGARAALPYLEESGGALICVGSTASDRALPLLGAYSASKHALKGWVDALRLELIQAGSPVRVTLVKPSSIDTPLFAKAKTLLGVEPRPMPPVYHPELAAAAIVRAAEGDEREVFVGGAGAALSLGERVSPKLVDLELLKVGFAAQRTDTPKAADAPHNLYAPVEHDGGVTGNFRGTVHERSAYQSVAAHRTVTTVAAAGALGAAAAALGKSRVGLPLAGLFALGAVLLTPSRTGASER